MRKGLGRGFSHLVAQGYASAEAANAQAPIDEIHVNPDQPRKSFPEESIDELARSIAEHGVLQPLTVERDTSGQLILVAGERRLRAAKRAGLTTVPVIIRPSDERKRLILALVENLQREDIGPIDCAAAYRQLTDKFGLTQNEIAQQVGKSRSAVANALRLLRLPQQVLEALTSGAITEGHARALLSCDDPDRIVQLFKTIIEKDLTVRQVETMVQERGVVRERRKPMTARSESAAWTPLEDALRLRFSTPVKISAAGKGGRIQIDFYSEDELQRVLDLLGVTL